MPKQKFYVVWNGAEDGVYTSWDACREAVEGFSGAKYQSFKTEAEAEEAFEMGYEAWKEHEKELGIGTNSATEHSIPHSSFLILPKPSPLTLHVQAIRARWNTGVCICAPGRKYSIMVHCGAPTTWRTEDATVNACFDADRLDLGRVGITPDPNKMATVQGRFIAEKMQEENSESDWLLNGG